MKKRIRVLFDPDCGDGPPNGAFAFLAWFERQIEGIPLESQGGARIEIDAETREDGRPYPTVEVIWERPETPAEETSRLQEAALKATQQERLERHTLAVLREKYP